MIFRQNAKKPNKSKLTEQANYATEFALTDAEADRISLSSSTVCRMRHGQEGQELDQPESHDLSTEEQALMDAEFANRPRIEDVQRCRLPASGFTQTLNPVYDWASTVVAYLQTLANSQKVEAGLWAYREQFSEWLALDLTGGVNAHITFLIGEPHNFHSDLDDGGVVAVPDMTEALHMAGIICDAFNAKVDVGCRANEVNRYCTPGPWGPNQTNARLKVVTPISGKGLST